MRCCSLLIFSLAVTGLLPCRNLAQEPPAPHPAHQNRAARLKALREEIQVHSDDDVKRITRGYADVRLAEMRQIFQQEVLDVLAQSDDPGVLRSDLTDLLKRVGLNPSEKPAVFKSVLQGVPVIVTGFDWSYGPGGIPYIRSMIDGYRKTGLTYKLVDQAGDGLDGCELILEQLSSPRPNEMWFFAHGHVIGASRFLEPLRIHSFDGYRFQLLWDAGERRMDPHYEITKDAVTTTYFHDGDRDHEFRDVIALTSSGPVVSTVEIK